MSPVFDKNRTHPMFGQDSFLISKSCVSAFLHLKYVMWQYFRACWGKNSTHTRLRRGGEVICQCRTVRSVGAMCIHSVLCLWKSERCDLFISTPRWLNGRDLRRVLYNALYLWTIEQNSEITYFYWSWTDFTYKQHEIPLYRFCLGLFEI